MAFGSPLYFASSSARERIGAEVGVLNHTQQQRQVDGREAVAGLHANQWQLAVEFVDVADAVQKEMLAGFGHLRRRSRESPLQVTTLAANTDRAALFADIEPGGEDLRIRRILESVRVRGHAAEVLTGVLHPPDLDVVREALASWIATIVSGRRPRLEDRLDLEWGGEDFVLARLALSRITHAVSHVPRLQPPLTAEKTSGHTDRHRRSGIIGWQAGPWSFEAIPIVVE